MIDTIVLRIHDLRKHAHLEKIINRDFKSKGELRNMIVDKNEIEKYSEAFKANHPLMIDYFRVQGIGTHRLRYKNLKRLNNSGHYILNAFINKERDFVELNFSIPKYIFGTNVLQFVLHHWNRDFIYYKNISLKHNLSTTYIRLVHFLNYFFKAEFPEGPKIDFRDVEVNRIDLSFNQVFLSKQQALEYLEFQKSIQRKHTRTNSDKYREYESSLMYITDRYSLKIYHKGYEYSKNDIKEHKRINDIHRKEVFNISELQNFADKILRYEITFRKSMLSYIYNQHIFRKRCPEHKILYQSYQNVEKVNFYNDRLSKRLALFKTEKGRQRYLEKYPYKRISTEDKKAHRYITKILNRNKTFMLHIDDSINRYNHFTDNYGYYEPRALFSKKLLDLCGMFFLEFIKEFQVKEKPSINVVSELIDNYNKINYKKLPKNEMLKFFMMLQNKTFDEIKKSGIYSKSTFYRYKQRFKEIGITENCIVPTSMIAVNMDLSNYHTNLMIGKRLIIRRL